MSLYLIIWNWNQTQISAVTIKSNFYQFSSFHKCQLYLGDIQIKHILNHVYSVLNEQKKFIDSTRPKNMRIGYFVFSFFGRVLPLNLFCIPDDSLVYEGNIHAMEQPKTIFYLDFVWKIKFLNVHYDNAFSI